MRAERTARGGVPDSAFEAGGVRGTDSPRKASCQWPTSTIEGAAVHRVGFSGTRPAARPRLFDSQCANVTFSYRESSISPKHFQLCWNCLKAFPQEYEGARCADKGTEGRGFPRGIRQI